MILLEFISFFHQTAVSMSSVITFSRAQTINSLILNSPDTRDEMCIGILLFCLHFQTSCPLRHTLNADQIDTYMGSKMTMPPSSATLWLFPSVIKSRINISYKLFSCVKSLILISCQHSHLQFIFRNYIAQLHLQQLRQHKTSCSKQR